MLMLLLLLVLHVHVCVVTENSALPLPVMLCIVNTIDMHTTSVNRISGWYW